MILGQLWDSGFAPNELENLWCQRSSGRLLGPRLGSLIPGKVNSREGSSAMIAKGGFDTYKTGRNIAKKMITPTR